MAVAGATGLIGRALVLQASARQGLSAGRRANVLALVREGRSARSAEQPWPKGVQSLPVDYARLGQAEATPLPTIDLALCALGTTIAVAGSQTAFRAVDLDAVLAFATAARAAGAQRLAVVSSMGADANSRVFYNRVKGEAEQALIAMGWPRLVIARPSLLIGDRAALGQATRPGELIAQRLAPALAWLTPRRLRPIAADIVARAMWRAVMADGPAVQLLLNDELQRLGQGN